LDDPEQLDVVSGGIKTLSFSWPAIEEATHYKLLNNPDGASGFSQVGSDITSISIDITIPVHLTDWANASYLVESYDDSGLLTTSPGVSIVSLMLDSIGYGKASNPGENDRFGTAVAISGDGLTLAVGVSAEDSSSSSNQANNSAEDAGAVYVFTQSSIGVWMQQAYIKASYIDINDNFGFSLSLSEDGNVLAVGAPNESSSAAGINGDEINNEAPSSGAVYLFQRSGSGWSQSSYIKASNAEATDVFGYSVELSRDGSTLAVGAINESSDATGIDGDQDNNSAYLSGAVYVFFKKDDIWRQQAYVKASNPDSLDRFGRQVALSNNGDTLVVSSTVESSGSNDQTDNSAPNAGAVYIFTRINNNWIQQAFLKAENVGASDRFGYSIAISADGQMIAVGAPEEDSNAIGVDGDSVNNAADNAGAVYQFVRTNDTWTQSAYIKAHVSTLDNRFGENIALTADGKFLAISATREDSEGKGIDGDSTVSAKINSGAVFIFTQSSDIWRQTRYVKASNTDKIDYFGESLGFSDDGSTLAVGAFQEDGNGQGFTGDQTNNSLSNSGAVYIY